MTMQRVVDFLFTLLLAVVCFLWGVSIALEYSAFMDNCIELEEMAYNSLWINGIGIGCFVVVYWVKTIATAELAD